jgi:hypothetical protein
VLIYVDSPVSWIKLQEPEISYGIVGLVTTPLSSLPRTLSSIWSAQS